jgi:hypothetical protein
VFAEIRECNGPQQTVRWGKILISQHNGSDVKGIINTQRMASDPTNIANHLQLHKIPQI